MKNQFFLILAMFFTISAISQTWSIYTTNPSMAAGNIKGQVNCMLVSGDTTWMGGNVRGGGKQYKVDQYINGSLGPNMGGDLTADVRALVKYRGEIYFGCYGDAGIYNGNANESVGRWDGTKWVGIPSGRQVIDMVVYKDKLFVLSRDFLSYWDGTDITIVARFDKSGGVYNSLALYDGHLYVSGAFNTVTVTNSDGTIESHAWSKAIRYNNNTWEEVPNGSLGEANPQIMVTHGDDLYCSGSFSSSDYSVSSSFAKFDRHTD